VIFVISKVEIQIGGGREPHFGIALLEEHGPIFDDLVLIAKLDLRHRLCDIGFHAHDLKTVRGDPRPSFQRNGMKDSVDAVAANSAGQVGTLLEVDDPGRAALKFA